MTQRRSLSPDERAAWQRLTASVEPLEPPRSAPPRAQAQGTGAGGNSLAEGKGAPPPTQLDLSKLMAGGSPRAQISAGARAGADRGWTIGGAPPGMSAAKAPHSQTLESVGLDSHWERDIKSGRIAPDFTLDLHGHTLDEAHHRLDDGIAQAKAMGARVVLLIAGRARGGDAAGRGERRGAIRAKILDWLAAGPHHSDIAAIRAAHRKHGGAGAFYLILRRRR